LREALAACRDGRTIVDWRDGDWLFCLGKCLRCHYQGTFTAAREKCLASADLRGGRTNRPLGAWTSCELLVARGLVVSLSQDILEHGSCRGREIFLFFCLQEFHPGPGLASYSIELSSLLNSAGLVPFCCQRGQDHPCCAAACTHHLLIFSHSPPGLGGPTGFCSRAELSFVRLSQSWSRVVGVSARSEMRLCVRFAPPSVRGTPRVATMMFEPQ
jgi:hypothetical protein